MDAHPAGPCPGNLLFKMLAIIVTALDNEPGIPVFGGTKIFARKGFGRAGLDAFAAGAALAFHWLARFQQGIG